MIDKWTSERYLEAIRDRLEKLNDNGNLDDSTLEKALDAIQTLQQIDCQDLKIKQPYKCTL